MGVMGVVPFITATGPANHEWPGGGGSCGKDRPEPDGPGPRHASVQFTKLAAVSPVTWAVDARYVLNPGPRSGGRSQPGETQGGDHQQTRY
jgi:hypothetical protein